ncbi:Gfo/Idh/MocA family protein [Amycolatopsis sacchari]|uniref:Predicted dehydrogenase n=1 Tax=Amycolatopsis sacchari TaxID=115433 RepID=A0A1I3XJ76_9PSEU|nr:Gfo/Idh/MocA family oxidoreductase [Amycolatopsis sacchari]SFK19657.1 Predicted dehydrogenase [Amycolatopsis sacchari]
MTTAAIVGTGMIAGVHRRAVLLNGGTVAGVLGSRPERSEAVAAEWGVSAFRTYQEVLESDVDVVHICSPNGTHHDYAIAALEAGKHVVCEKPLGMSVAEAERMADKARESGLVATVPFVYRFHPVVREIRARRIAGEFGEWNLLHGSYLQDWLLSPGAANWRVDPVAGGRSRAFADVGSHWCDLVEWVSGERLAELTAATSIAYPERPSGSVPAFDRSATNLPLTPVSTEDSALLLFRTERGVLGSATISQVAAGRKNRLWFELDGSLGSAAFDQEQPEQAWLGGERGAQIIVRDPAAPYPDSARLSSLPAGHAQGYAQCFESFVADTYAAIRGEKPEGLPTFADGLRSARIVEAVLASAESRRWETV